MKTFLSPKHKPPHKPVRKPLPRLPSQQQLKEVVAVMEAQEALAAAEAKLQRPTKE
jgi:hypothetical protein